MNPRAVAAKVINEVASGGVQLNQALEQHIDQLSNPADQPLMQELSYGVLRWWFLLDEFAQVLLQKPLKQKDFDVHCLILVGIYQLRYTRIAEHAAVSETVAAVRQLKKKWADKLVNAVLRRYLREYHQLELLQTLSVQAQFAHPQWFINEVQAAWPEQWQTILQANNQHPPMTLRVNRQKTSRQVYLLQLQQAGLSASAATHCNEGIVLERAANVAQLPGFADGLVSVQDSAAQLAAQLLDVRPGQRVLDVCAAPGGKTAHILESQPNLGEMVAVDVDPRRLQRVSETLQRLGLAANLVQGDATRTAQWWDGNRFDRILLDAPCSATGVIRRHPDIKLLRTSQDVKRVTGLQWQILESVWPLLKSGGMLLYATCSILPQENEKQLAAFIEHNNNACYQGIDGPWGDAREHGRQIFPGQDNMDGFYYACVVKRDQ